MNSVHKEVINFAYIDLDGAIRYWKEKDNLSIEEQELLTSAQASRKDLEEKFHFLGEDKMSNTAVDSLSIELTINDILKDDGFLALDRCNYVSELLSKELLKYFVILDKEEGNEANDD